MNIIIVAGIPGAGKSSILQEVTRQLPNVLVVNYGSIMLQEAAEAGITRDMLRKFPFRKQQQIGIQAANKIKDLKTKELVIVDTHAMVKTTTGYCPGLPLPVLETLSPMAYTLVECDPEIILARRGGDSARNRDQETIQELLLHQSLSRSFLTACCMHTNSLFCQVQNNGPSIDQNALPLIGLIRSNI